MTGPSESGEFETPLHYLRSLLDDNQPAQASVPVFPVASSEEIFKAPPEKFEHVVPGFEQDNGNEAVPDENNYFFDDYLDRNDDNQKNNRTGSLVRGFLVVSAAIGMAIIGSKAVDREDNSSQIVAQPQATPTESQSEMADHTPESKPSKSPKPTKSPTVKPETTKNPEPKPSETTEQSDWAANEPSPTVTETSPLPELMPPVLSTPSPTPEPAPFNPARIKTMTYNVLGASETDGKNAPYAEYADSNERTKIQIEVIKNRDLDVVFLQDLEGVQRTQLMNNIYIANNYDIYPKTADYGTDANMSENSILLKKGRFNVVEEGGRKFQYYLPGYNEVPYLAVEDTMNAGLKLLLSNIREPLDTPKYPDNLEKRKANAVRHQEFASAWSARGYQVVMGGDLASGADHLPCRIITKDNILDDMYDVLMGGNGDCLTAADYEINPQFDRVFVSGGLRVNRVKDVVNENIKAASTHPPFFGYITPRAGGS